MANVDLNLELSDVLRLFGDSCTSEKHGYGDSSCDDCVNGYVPNEKFREFVRLAIDPVPNA